MGDILSTENTASDFVGYEALIDFIEGRSLHKLDGDLIEIGAFMGGGTIKLARYAHKYGKKVFVIDIFDPSFDQTKDTSGSAMSAIYEAFLQGRSQKDIYYQATEPFNNIHTIEKDSKKIRFAKEQRFMFGFIDGNHHPAYVRNDFFIVWNNLVPGGIIAFHDYNFDLPKVTSAINSLIQKYRNDISDTFELKERHILLLTKK